MMKKSLSRLILLAPVALSLTACGLDLNEVYESDGYNNVIFKKNYYQKYSSQIAPKSDGKNPLAEGVRNDSIRSVTTLDNVSFTTKYEDAAIYDPEITLVPLKYELNSQPDDPKTSEYYGDRKKANLIDDQFKYGYLSKLYDGWMFCGGRYQLSRVQIDERGFGQIFEKEMTYSDYFVLQFKASMNDPYYQDVAKRPQAWNPAPIESKIKLNINFYLRDGNYYEVKNLVFNLDNVPTNYPEFHEDAYMFLAFDLKGLNLQRCCGYSINYEFDREDYINKAKSASNPLADQDADRLEYALMLYEVFMPNSKWR